MLARDGRVGSSSRTFKLPLTADSTLPLREVLWAVLTLNVHWAVIIVLYVFGLNAVDVYHALFLIMFCVVTPSPRVREKFWAGLMYLTSLALVAVYVWGFLAGPYCSSNVALCSGTFIEVFDSIHDDNWVYANVAVMVVLVLSSLKGSIIANDNALAALRRTGYKWVNFPAIYAQWQRRYGIYACYVLYGVLALIPPIDVRSAVTLILFFVTLLVHMSFGLSTLSENRSRCSAWVAKLLMLMATVQGIILVLRYLYQFNAIEDFFVKHVWHLSFLTPEELGLVG